MEHFDYEPAQLALIENSPVPCAVYRFIDRRVVTVALSAGFCALFGFDDRQEARTVMDRDMYRDVHPDDAARIADAALRFAREDGEYNVIYRTRTRGEYRIVHARGEHVYPRPEVRLAVVWYFDEGPYTENGSQRESELNGLLSSILHEDSLYRRVNYDFLTGLPSMTYFFELADAGRRSLAQQGETPAILFVDLSGMKYFNRQFGFAEGDLLIKAMARLLVKHFSNENCSRFGQDHFAVFTRADGLEETLEELLRESRELNDGKTLPVRIGVYLDRQEDVDVSAACDRAKMACDVDRKSYESVIEFFDDSLQRGTEHHQYIVSSFGQALAEQWIEVYYQPIIRTANGRVSDEEALARWVDPEKGMLPPDRFIPVLEDAKLIYKLDLYVLEQVLRKMTAQAQAGLFVVPTSVNLSRTDFDCCDIVEEIRRRVDASPIDRSQITIEITESVIGSDFDFMKEQITRFQELGFHVWMDDFGSGYSSLDVLQDLRFDLIKFDMRFMQQFDRDDKNRIILTELIKMAIGLGIDTVVEGVETPEQVNFLREVGCTKLQGYYFCRPIPMAEIWKRYREGKQIGFENPAESDYYAALGRINLYDLAVVANEDTESFRHYFDTLPMALLELDENGAQISRCNRSYRDFMERAFGIRETGVFVPYARMTEGTVPGFASAVMRCRQQSSREVVDENMPDGSVIHAFVRRISANPVTGVVACAVVVLSVTDRSDRQEVTFSHIARALAADYFNLYYVDLDTEQYTEYRPDPRHRSLQVEKQGADFFRVSRQEALELIYEEDREAFIAAFTKENVLREVSGHGTFTLNYRLMLDGAPVYVNMKVTRIQTEGDHIIIGISNVDAQMRHQEELERIREEEITYTRIAALAGNFIAVYTVDPETEHYARYSATRDYEGLGLVKEGDDFFRASRQECVNTLCPEDVELFQSVMDRETVLREIEANGAFSVNYRLMIGGRPRYVSLKMVLVQEKDGPQLIAGISDIDAQVRRE